MEYENLAEIVRRHGTKSREQMQVVERMLELLPNVLLEVRRSLGGGVKGAAADRRALTDQVYLSKIDEVIDLWGGAVEARIQFETHRMLLQAKQSLAAYHRARILSNRSKASRL